MVADLAICSFFPPEFESHFRFQESGRDGLDGLQEAHTILNASHATIDFSWVDLVLSNYTSTSVKEGVL